MSRCEMCGTKSDSLTTIKTGGAELDVCDNCTDMGTIVQDESNNTSSETKYSTSSSQKSSDTPSSSPQSMESPSENSSKKQKSNASENTVSELRMDYGGAIRNAREQKGMTLSELAHNIGEKESHIRNIEHENRKPTESLQRKIEDELNIDLTLEGEDMESHKSANANGATIGDMVDFDNL